MATNEPRIRVAGARPGDRDQTLVLFEFLPHGGTIEIPVAISLSRNQSPGEYPLVWQTIEDLLLLLYKYAQQQRHLTEPPPPNQAKFL